MTRVLAVVVLLLVVAFTPLSFQSTAVKVGSKKFTESVILGELIKLTVEDAQIRATHYRELGGTNLVFQAMLSGDIDVYPEHTGTIAQEILAGETDGSITAMRTALEERGVLMSQPLGFNNTYAMGMLKSRARELDIKKISDLLRHPDLVFGFSSEFMDREDGWRHLRRRFRA